MRWIWVLTALLIVGSVNPAYPQGCGFPPPPPGDSTGDSSGGRSDPEPEPEPDPEPEPTPTPTPPPFSGPNSGVGPGTRTPSEPEEEAPEPPTTPGPEDAPEPPAPSEPDSPEPTTPRDPGHDTGPPAAPPPDGGGGGGGSGPATPSRGSSRTSNPRGKATSGAADSWRYWWEFNREHLISIRHMLARRTTLTGAAAGRKPDPLRAHRPAVLAALRALAADDRAPRRLRGAALVALGRMGSATDADLFLRILRDFNQPQPVVEAAALALGLLPEIDGAMRGITRDYLVWVLERRNSLPTRARGLALISAGLRARDDKALVMALAQRSVAGAHSSSEAAVLAYACGLAGDRMVTPELMNAARRSQFAGRKLSDVGRSHALHALGIVGDPAAASTLVKVLRSRTARYHTKRSAVLALGRMLREDRVPKADRARVEHNLVTIMRSKKDAVMRGFAALALAGAKEPAGVHEAMDIVSGGGLADVKPYVALALGLAAPKLDERLQRRVQAFLARQLQKARDRELAAALCIGLGLAGATEALPDLLDRVEDTSLPASLRGAAANGAGMLGRGSARAEKVLIDAIVDGPSELVGEAALGLGLLGRRSGVGVLLKMAASARSSLAQGRIIMALGYLGHHSATEPLLKILANPKKNASQREYAAIAFGLLGDARDVDPLFALGADFNYLALTAATREVLEQF